MPPSDDPQMESPTGDYHPALGGETVPFAPAEVGTRPTLSLVGRIGEWTNRWRVPVAVFFVSLVASAVYFSYRSQVGTDAVAGPAGPEADQMAMGLQGDIDGVEGGGDDPAPSGLSDAGAADGGAPTSTDAVTTSTDSGPPRRRRRLDDHDLPQLVDDDPFQLRRFRVDDRTTRRPHHDDDPADHDHDHDPAHDHDHDRPGRPRPGPRPRPSRPLPARSSSTGRRRPGRPRPSSRCTSVTRSTTAAGTAPGARCGRAPGARHRR